MEGKFTAAIGRRAKAGKRWVSPVLTEMLALLLFASTDLTAAQQRTIANRYDRLIRGAKTICFEEVVARPEGQKSTTRTLMARPRTIRRTILGEDRKPAYELWFVNNTQLNLEFETKTFTKLKRRDDMPMIDGLEPFLSKDKPGYIANPVIRATVYKGVPAYALAVNRAGVQYIFANLIVRRDTLHPLACEYRMVDHPEAGKIHEYVGFKLNQRVKKSEITWSPPKGFREMHYDGIGRIIKGG